MGCQLAQCTASCTRQHGQVIILTVLILALGTGFLVYSMAGFRSIDYGKDSKTELALAQVKQALIGWSAARTPTATSPNIRPGELPCPDIDNDGLDDACAAGAIGRVPWKTLGIPEPLDGSGETLWYAISGPFRYKYTVTTPPITSDTLGNLLVFQSTSATTLTSQAIAVLFAPGPPLGTQSRGATTALCSTTGTTIQQRNCAANYLESTGGANNAQTGGPFIQATASGTFNDRVLAITSADLMPLVEQRVAREMMAILERYKAATGVYPWSDLSDGNSNNAYNRPRFPCGTAQPTDWGSGGTPVLPDWLANGCTNPVTGWTSVVYYAVARNRLEGGGATCITCSASTLTVTNSGNQIADLCLTGGTPFACSSKVLTSGAADLVLITPGAATGSRSSGWPTSGVGPISGYFEDAENSDNNDDNYVVPSSTTNDRDRMYIVR
jgi:hypothetical protein